MSRISSKYFDNSIYLLHVTLGGINYCRIYRWYTSGITFKLSHFCVSYNGSPFKSLLTVIAFSILLHSNYNFTLKTLFIDKTIIVMNEVNQVVLFIPIPLFWIPHINTMMHGYNIDNYCYSHNFYCLFIVGYKFHFFVNSI